MAEPMEKPFGHEPDAISFRIVLICAAVLALVIIAIAVGMHFVLSQAVMPNHPAVVTRPAPIPPPPRLQADPQLDLANFRARKEAVLSSYGWTDPSHDYAHIPIQRAMQIYAEQHAHAAAPASASSSAQPAVQGARP